MEKIRAVFKTGFYPAIAKLIGVLLGSLFIYIFAFTLPANLLKLYNRAGLDGHLLQDAGILGFVRIIAGFVGVGLLYMVGFRAANRTSSKTAWIIGIGGTLAFIVVFLFMAPFDAFYISAIISHGRLVGVYRSNACWKCDSEFSAR